MGAWLALCPRFLSEHLQGTTPASREIGAGRGAERRELSRPGDPARPACSVGTSCKANVLVFKLNGCWLPSAAISAQPSTRVTPFTHPRPGGVAWGPRGRGRAVEFVRPGSTWSVLSCGSWGAVVMAEVGGGCPLCIGRWWRGVGVFVGAAAWRAACVPPGSCVFASAYRTPGCWEMSGLFVPRGSQTLTFHLCVLVSSS